MARVIQSPGIQINEIDLSFNSSLPIGTNVLVHGFAPQGPSYELIYVSNKDEFEQIFFGTNGATNAAERYFYHSCREILNTQANLLVTRLPYGSGDGIGFDGEYSALIYPMSAHFYVSAISGIGIGSGQIGVDFEVGALSAAGDITVSTTLTSYNMATYYRIGTPILTSLNETQYQAIEENNLVWGDGTSANVGDGGSLGNAGFIVLNKGKTTVNELYEGYYLAIADNSTVSLTGYDAVKAVKSVNTLNTEITVNTNMLNFTLTGGVDDAASMSREIETSPLFDFSNIYYEDGLVMYLYKIRQDTFGDVAKLQKIPVESYVGSFNPTDQQANPKSGNPETFYLQNLVNNRSDFVKLIVNKNLAERTKWIYGNVKQVVVENTYENVKNVGLYATSKPDPDKQVLGDIPAKIKKALLLADQPDIVPLDIVVECGLGTAWSHVFVEGQNYHDQYGFDDTSDISSDLEALGDPDNGESSALAEKYKTIFNIYEGFCRDTRKDCMFIGDPVRDIFVKGEDTKTLSKRTNNFTQHIYYPLRNLYSTANSNYAAVYSNWVKYYDSNAAKFIWMPFSGWMAAIMVRMDTVLQPWFAPAGLNNGIVRNVVDIAINPNQKQRDLLYKIGINPVVFFPQDGFVVWGQKTLQAKPSAFDRINVRRLFLTLEKAVGRIARYFVMEPNTVFTRTRFVNVLKPLFDVAKNNQGLYDYAIVCDERNNTPDVIDNNELHCDIYIKPVRTAEFIIINFIATRTGQDFNELIQ